MKFGVQRSAILTKYCYCFCCIILCSIIFIEIHAQGLNRGGVKKQDTILENSNEVVDSLSTNPSDSIRLPTVELSYQERFKSVVFTKNLNEFNYQNLDTAFRHFHHFDPINRHQFERYTIGPLGAPSYSFLPEFNSHLKFDIGMHQFKPYKFNQDSITIFKLNAPYTKLNWNFGTKALQSFEALHANRIKNIAQFGMRFRRMGGEGYYQSQKTGHTDFSAYLSYDTPNKRYSNIFTILHNKYAFQQNGGIVEDSVNYIFAQRIDEGVIIPNTQVFRRDIVPVFLENAVSREKLWNVAINQYINFGKYFNDAITDTTTIKRFVPQFRFKHRSSYSNNHYTYEGGSGRMDLYPQNLRVQPGYYIDSILQKKWHHELAFIQTGNSADDTRIKHLPFKSYMGLHIENIRLTQQFNSDSLKTNNTWLQAKVDGKVLENIHYEVDFQYALFKNSYQNKGHYLRAKLSYQLPETEETWAIQYLNNQYKAPFLYHTYQNNFYDWDETLPLTKIQQLDAYYDNQYFKFRTAYQQIRFKNVLLLDTISEIDSVDYNPNIQYLPTAGTLHRFTIDKKFNWGWWHMDHHLIIQQTKNDQLFIPELVYHGSFYYNDDWFKRALSFTTGIDVYYTSNFKLPVYHPVVGKFFPQQTNNAYQFYPVIDFFFNFKIKTATFFFKIAYANQGLFQRGYYAANNYPQADIAAQGGISWRFFD